MSDTPSIRSSATKGFDVAPFETNLHQAVIDFVLPIQRDEFGVSVTLEDQPDLGDPAGYFQNGAGNFWVAQAGSQVIGTIGLLDITNKQLALKKMFVGADWRGAEFGVAACLLTIAIDWARANDVTDIYLGSTAVMKRAHRFYEKYGFERYDKPDLPETFPIVPVDTEFFRLGV